MNPFCPVTGQPTTSKAWEIYDRLTRQNMTRLHEPLAQHIHSALVDEMNEMSIRIKLHYIVDFAKRKELADAGKMPPEPTHEELAELLDKACREMNQCTQPYKIHQVKSW